MQVEARSNYNTKFTVMSGVDDKVVADKQSFLKRRTTSPPTRSAQCRTGRFRPGAAAAVVVSIDDIKTTASVAANASISTKGGAVPCRRRA